MINTIYISNILECFYKSYLQMTPKKKHHWILHDSVEGNRALFYGKDKKAIITTHPIKT